MSMSRYETRSYCDGASGQCNSYSSSSSVRVEHKTKPIEIYAFIDPACPNCWGLEPIIKKLTIQYGQYFKFRYVLGGTLNTLNVLESKTKNEKAEQWEQISRRYGMPCNGDVWLEQSIKSTFPAVIAVKAAELQGKQAGFRYLRKLREAFFLKKQNISEESALLRCAEETNLDLDEFKRDIQGQGAVKAYQCDMKTTREMEVDTLPTLVFLNAKADEEGVKISGNYPYKAYEQVIFEMLGRQPDAGEPPTIEGFLQKYPFVSTKEIAMVYDLTCEEAERKMKKLQLQQVVKRVPVKNGTFWRA
ncbi:MAG TPA: ClpXP adapter SpxH family protein [Bacillales bacterium]|nr:ClpXP adapter SpxH family protein [Bacillales bacterium]